MDNMPLFSEGVRRELTRDLRRFVGEPAAVDFRDAGRKASGNLHTGVIVAVYRNGFLLGGGEIGTRAFYSCADLFAGHARIVDGPAASAIARTVARLRQELARFAPGKAPRDQVAALLD